MHIFAIDCIRCAVALPALEAAYPAPRANRRRSRSASDALIDMLVIF